MHKNMNQTIHRQLAAIPTIAILVGCGVGVESSAPVAVAKIESATAISQTLAQTKQNVTTSLGKAAPKVPAGGQAGPQEHTAFYRADPKPSAMPKVIMSKGDQAACRVKVGDAMPTIELPKLSGDGKAKLANLFGKKATVVIFWKGDRRMGQQQLADLGKDVVQPFGKEGVSIVGVAVDQSPQEAQQALKKAGATFTNLHDADGKAFALMGTGRFPRTYVLDPSGKIVWFDIEYSMATRRELHQALRTLAASK
jgi:peroxiredoxin